MHISTILLLTGLQVTLGLPAYIQVVRSFLTCRAEVGSGLARRHPEDVQIDVELEKRRDDVDNASYLVDRSSDLEERAPTASEAAKKDDKKDKKDKKKKDKKKDKKKTSATATPTA